LNQGPKGKNLRTGSKEANKNIKARPFLDGGRGLQICNGRRSTKQRIESNGFENSGIAERRALIRRATVDTVPLVHEGRTCGREKRKSSNLGKGGGTHVKLR